MAEVITTVKSKGRPIKSKGSYAENDRAAELHAYRYEQKAEKEHETHCAFCGYVCKSSTHRDEHREMYFLVMDNN